MESLTVLDIVCVVVLGLGALAGSLFGVLVPLAGIVAALAGALLAWLFYMPLSWLGFWAETGLAREIIAWLFLFVLGSIVTLVALRRALRWVLPAQGRKRRRWGAVVGVCWALLVLVLALRPIQRQTVAEPVLKRSAVAGAVLRLGAVVDYCLPTLFPAAPSPPPPG